MKLKSLYSLLMSFSLLFVLDATAFTQGTLEKKITLQVRNSELRKVLKLIESQAMVKFAYSPENLNYSKISLNVEKQKLSEVLDEILDNQNMVYEAIDNLIILKKNSLMLKDIEITGKVVDENGLPLPGVSVKVKNTTSGTSTNVDGSYSLRAVDENAIVVFSFIGFTSQEIAVNNRSVLNISMIPDAKALSEVVVIGYGTQKRENIIGSVSQVTAKDLENRPVTQLSNALTGQMPGVTVVQRSGRPGGESAGSIRIRGVGSFGANSEALVIVDGIPGDFNDIDPNDVESISVLKDASSAAIYGARAANGVILVTTKTGQQGKTKVSYNGYTGIQSPTAFPDYASSAEFAEFYNVALGTEFFTPEEIQKFRDGSDPDNFPNTDFLRAIFSRNGIQTGNNLSISGGGPTNQFNLSLGHLYQEGLVVRNDFSRFNVRLNMNTDLGPKFKLTTRLSAIKVNLDEPAPPANTPETRMMGIVGQAVRFLPTYAGRLSNGDYDPGNTQQGTPISLIESNKSFFKDASLALTSNLRLDYNVIDDLKLSLVAGYNQTNREDRLFLATQRINDNITLGPNQLTQNSRTNTYYTVQGLAEYNKTFGKHQLGILGGYSFEKNNNSNFMAFRDKLPGNDLTELGVGSDDNQQSDGTSAAWALESQFARANYSFANKYLIEGVVRRDGSSRFPTTRKYAVFPSAAIGWRVSQESFFKDNIFWISELKLKASIGILGNQNIANYPYQNVLVNGQTYSFGGIINSGAARLRITDPTLQWESTRNTDVGLDMQVFNEKLNFSATYFDRYTYDILSSPGGSVSNTLGFNLSAQNSGKLKNKGWEFTVNHNNKIGNFSYNIGGNLSIIKNEVLDLGVGNITQPNGMIGNGSTLFIGSPLQIYYGYQADGLFVDDADVEAWVDQTAVNPGSKPGDIRYKDISGPDGVPDGKVDNTYDRVVLGSNIPKYTYGINLGAGFKGFDFSMLLQGIAGVKSYQSNYVGWAFYNGATVQRWQIAERWTPENPDRNATYPRFEVLPNANTPNTQESSFWMIDGSYLRIKNAQIGYTIPAAVMQKLNIGSIRLYLSGENLLTWSNFRQGWDPETGGNYNDVNSTTTSGDYYPLLSNYTFGINVKF